MAKLKELKLIHASDPIMFPFYSCNHAIMINFGKFCTFIKLHTLNADDVMKAFEEIPNALKKPLETLAKRHGKK